MTSKTVELAADMNCRACQYRVEKALKEMDAVLSFKANLRRRKVTIEFDPSRAEETHLRTVIDNALSHGLLLE